MKAHRVWALAWRDFLIFRRVKWKLAEFFYFPITTVVIWGLFAVSLQDLALEAGMVVLTVNVFWNFAYLAQSTVNMQMMEDSWSGSLKQILVTGISEFEYLVARLLSATAVSLLVVALMWVISYWFFDLRLVRDHLALVTWLTGLTLLASLGLSVMVAGCILLFGREYGFLSWTILQIFILFSAPFYPVQIFPSGLRPLVWAMPFTAVFESVRALLDLGGVPPALLQAALATSVAYLGLSLPFFAWAFQRARKTGTLVRLG